MGAPVTLVTPDPVTSTDKQAGTSANPIFVSQSAASQAGSANPTPVALTLHLVALEP